MSYYWFHTKKMLKNARDKYHNKGGKKMFSEHHVANKEVLR